MKPIDQLTLDRMRDPFNMLWRDVSRNFILTEDHIREFADVLNWHFVCLYQDMTEDFMIEFVDYLHLKCLERNSKITISEHLMIELILRANNDT